MQDEGDEGGYSDDEGDEGGSYDEGEGGAYDEEDNDERSYGSNDDGDEEWRSDSGYDDEAAGGGHGADACREKPHGAAGYSGGEEDPSASAADWDVAFYDRELSRTLAKLLRKQLPTADSHVTLSRLGSKIPPLARPYIQVSEMRYRVPLTDSRTHHPLLKTYLKTGCWKPGASTSKHQITPF